MKIAAAAIFSMLAGAAGAQELRTGAAAYGDWRGDAPGVARRITPADLPKDVARGAAASPRVIARPAEARLAAPPGFVVEPYATGLSGPRTLRFAANGDLFVAESRADRIVVLRAGNPEQKTIFARGLDGVFGLAFHPKTAALYAAGTEKILRFAYAPGDITARAAPETVVADLPSGGHSTRDLVFSRDGETLFVSIGSASNVGEALGPPPKDIAALARTHGLGATWGYELGRAAVVAYDAEGRNRRPFANGLRNCVGMALAPASDDLWCAVNERDMLGDDLPPDYATRVAPGGFYGWPWFYIGAHADPRPGPPPAGLADKIVVPDVLIQPHSAPLGIVFYEGTQFPPAYRGDAFVALHGSWNRARRTGYKIVRLRMSAGKPTGVYEDFVTGFVASDTAVWGRPVSVAVGPDGALYFSDDGAGVIWRVRYAGE
jgi:glucose/arabinose dehydrogenase